MEFKFRTITPIREIYRNYLAKELHDWIRKSDTLTKNKVQRTVHELDRYEQDTSFRRVQPRAAAAGAPYRGKRMTD